MTFFTFQKSLFKGNDFRLVAIIINVSQKVYIRCIGTHATNVKNI